MNRVQISAVFIAMLTGVLAGTSALAQTGREIPAIPPESPRVIPADHQSLPFSLTSKTSGTAATIKFLSMSQMAQPDRELVADAEPTVMERARFAGIELAQGQWSYQQIDCPALPGHLFLRYSRDNGVGDVSIFTASVPRGSSGQVYIIPILRRSYLLFSPAPGNALTIVAFNRIRAEESLDNPPGWLGTGLCYAALAGARPQIAQAEEAENGGPAPASASLQLSRRGEAVISFTDVAAVPRPMMWTMTFNRQGKLLKVQYAKAPQAVEKPIPVAPAEIQGKPVQSTDVGGSSVRIK